MCADKPNIRGACTKMYHGYQPIFIAFDVEYKAIVAHAVYTIVGQFYVCKAPPILLFYSGVPSAEGLGNQRVCFGKLSKFSFCNYYHRHKGMKNICINKTFY